MGKHIDILNVLRHELSARDIRGRGIGMHVVKKLLATGQVVRRKLPTYQNGESGWQYEYQTVISEEFPLPFSCTGSFCNGKNIHGDRQHKLCPPCRDAKLRHNRTERTKPSNVARANRTRRILRYNKRMEYLKRHPFDMFTGRPRGLEAFRRVVGWTRKEAAELFPPLAAAHW